MPEPHYFDANTTAWTQHPQFPEIQIKSLETRATHPHASMMLVEIAAGGVIEPHVHPIETETAFVLRGEAVLTVEGTDIALKPYTGASIPPGKTHSLRNTGAGTLELFAIHTPPAR